jgi:hypothetical protein
VPARSPAEQKECGKPQKVLEFFDDNPLPGLAANDTSQAEPVGSIALRMILAIFLTLDRLRLGSSLV